MSRFSPKYDSWLASPPVFLQKAVFFAIGPTARLIGYRTYYEKYMPDKLVEKPSQSLNVE
jgi:hypothetical protein